MRTAPTRLPSWIALLLLGVALAACGGKKNMKERIAHGEDLSEEAELLLNAAEQELQKLDADSAEKRLRKARELLAHPDVELYPDGEMLRSRLSELQERISPIREERARQELEAAVEKQREDVLRAMEALTTALEGLERKDASPPQVEGALKAVERVRERLKEGKRLEARSEDYAASVRRTEQRLEQAQAKIKTAQQVIEFVSGPAAARQEAEALVKKAKAERDPDLQLTLYTDARNSFRRCSDAAKQLLAKAPEIERSPILVEGQTTTPKAVTSSCGTKADSLDKTVAKLAKSKEARDKKAAAKAKKG
jgi:hypothetical protein